MITFIFSASEIFHRVCPQDHEDWGYDDEVTFQKDVIDYLGKEIVSIKKELDGYYDLVFEDDHKLSAISAYYIKQKEV